MLNQIYHKCHFPAPFFTWFCSFRLHFLCVRPLFNAFDGFTTQLPVNQRSIDPDHGMRVNTPWWSAILHPANKTPTDNQSVNYLLNMGQILIIKLTVKHFPALHIFIVTSSRAYICQHVGLKKKNTQKKRKNTSERRNDIWGWRRNKRKYDVLCPLQVASLLPPSSDLPLPFLIW